MRRPSNRSRLRPSCGLRRSAMSMPDMILRREIVASCRWCGNGQHVVQQPVHALPDLQQRLVRLDVDVAGAGLRGVAQDEVDELHDRRQLDVLGERRRIDQVVLAVAARLRPRPPASRCRACRRSPRARPRGSSRRSSRLEPGLRDDDRDRLLAGPELHVLQHRVVHRIGDRDPQHVAVDAERRDAALLAERDRQQGRDGLADLGRLAVEILEMQRRGDGGGDGGFVGEPETRPAPVPASSPSRVWASRPRASPAASTTPARISRSPTNPWELMVDSIRVSSAPRARARTRTSSRSISAIRRGSAVPGRERPPGLRPARTGGEPSTAPMIIELPFRL